VLTAYDKDVRDGVGSLRRIAKHYSVSVAWIRKLIRQRREIRTVEPRSPRSGRPPAFDFSARFRLLAMARLKPDATLKELAKAVGVECSEATTHRTLTSLGVRRTRKVGRRPRRPNGKSD